MATPTQNNGPGFIGTAASWFFCAFALIAAFFLIAEHKAHLGLLLPYVPFALLGVCVVLHAYMHGVVHRRPPPHGPHSGSVDPSRTNSSQSGPHSDH